MSTSYVHEFAKIGSVDDVYSIYDIALNNNAELEKIANDERAALQRAARGAVDYLPPSAFLQRAAPISPPSSIPAGGGHLFALPPVDPPKPAAKPAAAAAAAAEAAAEEPGTLRRAYRAIMANKGKSALGLAAGGAGAYALHRHHRRGNRD